MRVYGVAVLKRRTRGQRCTLHSEEQRRGEERDDREGEAGLKHEAGDGGQKNEHDDQELCGANSKHSRDIA